MTTTVAAAAGGSPAAAMKTTMMPAAPRVAEARVAGSAILKAMRRLRGVDGRPVMRRTTDVGPRRAGAHVTTITTTGACLRARAGQAAARAMTMTRTVAAGSATRKVIQKLPAKAGSIVSRKAGRARSRGPHRGLGRGTTTTADLRGPPAAAVAKVRAAGSATRAGMRKRRGGVGKAVSGAP
jgi:hypothetical protein